MRRRRKPLSGRDRAAQRIQTPARRFLARRRVAPLLMRAYRVEEDPVSGQVSYVAQFPSGTTGMHSDNPPCRRFAENYLFTKFPPPDTGTPWPCAWCETRNPGNQPKCKVCKREKTASAAKIAADAAKKAAEEAAKKAIEDEALAQKRMADAAEANAKASLRIPYVPTGAGARATRKREQLSGGLRCGRREATLSPHRAQVPARRWRMEVPWRAGRPAGRKYAQNGRGLESRKAFQIRDHRRERRAAARSLPTSPM